MSFFDESSKLLYRFDNNRWQNKKGSTRKIERVDRLIQVCEEIQPIYPYEYLYNYFFYTVKDQIEPNAFFRFVKFMKRENSILMREKCLILATFLQASLFIIICCIIFFQIDFFSNSGV